MMKINNRYISSLLTRILLSIVFILFILILKKCNNFLIIDFKNNLFNKSFNFIKVNKISQKVLGKDVFYYQNSDDIVEVMATSFDSKTKYYDGEKFMVSSNLPIGAISSGVVVFIGNKNEYKNTVIIQGIDGFNIWYGNVKDVNVKTYDYIQEGNLIGAADGDFIYLLIEKNNEYYTYEEYAKLKN